MPARERPRLRIGIDVGGTNTDAAVLDGTRVVAHAKCPTSPDVLTGVSAALRAVTAAIDPADVHSVVIGTTHFVNAITQARGLAPVLAIRIASTPAPLPPFTDWPDDLAAAARGAVIEVDGGHQFDGMPFTPLDLDHLRSRVADAAARGLADVAITAVFSPVNPDAEVRAQEEVVRGIPRARVTLSHDLGRIGLLERENAALLNAALRPLADRVVDGFLGATGELGLEVPIFLSQNDGTVMSLDTARRFPILTVASGPTNSMRGAAVEAGASDCVVVDVGGTTTDIGLLRGGFPRESTLAVDLGGVRTNFRMPDVVSLGIGGGSLVTTEGGDVRVGPASVGYEITTRGMVFGGSELTLTDVAVAAGRVVIGDPGRVADLDPRLVEDALRVVDEAVADRVQRVRIDQSDIPVVLVGGGGPLLGTAIAGASSVVQPPTAAVANAIGAALADISGEVDRIFTLAGRTREEAIDQAREEARSAAVAAGALPESLRVVDEEDVPIAHLPGGTATRVRVRVVGDLDLAREAAHA